VNLPSDEFKLLLARALLRGLDLSFGGTEDVVDQLAYPYNCFRDGEGCPGLFGIKGFPRMRRRRGLHGFAARPGIVRR
jgi:hypothetical protein